MRIDEWKVVAILIGCVTAGYAESIPTPWVDWQRGYGGSREDILTCLESTLSPGYFFGGYSSSTNGNITSDNSGAQDFWILRADSAGEAIWDRSLGGNRLDFLRAMVPTADQGLLVAGYSNSDPSGTKTSDYYGGGIFNLGDFWVNKLDSLGAKQWEKSYGGSEDDVLFAAAAAPEGGFFLGGYSMSAPSGTKTSTNHGLNDFWVVRTDHEGQSIWDRSFGGSSFDHCYAVAPTSEGGCILAGFSLSPADGNKESPPLGNEDLWMVCLSTNGNKMWERSFGGSGSDVANDICQASDGSFIVAGYSSSEESDTKQSQHFGSSDFWVLKIDGNGEKQWEKTFGGMGDDRAFRVRQVPRGGFVVAGYSYSGVEGNKSSPNRSTNVLNGDYWVVRLNEDGEKLWEQSYGGQRNDECYALGLCDDGGFLLGGKSLSGITGNKTITELGLEDYWVVKLGPDGLTRPPYLSVSYQTSQSIEASGFRFLLHGLSNHTYRLDVSLNLIDWIPFATNLLQENSVEIQDDQVNIFPGSFYRSQLLLLAP